MIDRKKFSERLKELRARDGITIIQLAAAVDLSKQSINNFENLRNLPSVDKLDALADYFNVTTDYLLGRTNRKRADE